MHSSHTKTTYQDAGVDVKKANQFVASIKSLAQATHHPAVLGGLGGYAGLYELPAGYQQPVLVSSTDGVGTKLCLAIEANQHHGIGIDLVAMCVNDLICCGATPLYFLDYYATGRLDPEQGQQLLAGISEGCLQSRAALIGGETAEMPSLYADNHYDLAGFAVGIVEKDRIIDGQQIRPGMHVIGLASSGCHANGYSLIRKLLREHNVSATASLENQSIRELLLAPTKIYVNSVLTLLQSFKVYGMAHITGGGFHENIPRILPDNCRLRCQRDAWPTQPIFPWLQQRANLSDDEMFQTFNMGIGYMIVVDESDVEGCLKLLSAQHEIAFHIGEILPREHDAVEIV